jgi:hypothetical protein
LYHSAFKEKNKASNDENAAHLDTNLLFEESFDSCVKLIFDSKIQPKVPELPNTDQNLPPPEEA